MKYVFIPLYGYVGGVQGGTWQEAAKIINKGIFYQRVEDLPHVSLKDNMREGETVISIIGGTL